VLGGQNGTLLGGTYVADRTNAPGKALQFNGTSDYASIPRSVAGRIGAPPATRAPCTR